MTELTDLLAYEQPEHDVRDRPGRVNRTARCALPVAVLGGPTRVILLWWRDPTCPPPHGAARPQRRVLPCLTGCSMACGRDAVACWCARRARSGEIVLLDYIAQQASGMSAGPGSGVEWEAELMLAGLQQLLGASMLPRSEHLPAPQRDALRVALGLQQGRRRTDSWWAWLPLACCPTSPRSVRCLPDRRCAVAGRHRPKCCRSLRGACAERIALVFAVREPTTNRNSTDCPSFSSRVSAITTRGGCWPGLCPDVWTRRCVIGSWPRREVIPWPCWSYRVA